MRLVVFTDLDGTLLDARTYRPDGAEEALAALAAAGGVLVPVTSKTRAEVALFTDILDPGGPAVLENGAICLFGGSVFATGPDRAALRAAVGSAAAGAAVEVRFLTDMDDAEIGRLTGLDPRAARLARSRERSEPFVFAADTGADARERLGLALAREGFVLRDGGRFLHAAAQGVDKGAGVQRVREWLARDAGGTPLRSIGIGDSENDVPLLLAVERPALVARPDGTHAPAVLAAVPGVRVEPLPGPMGWNRVVLEALAKAEAD